MSFLSGLAPWRFIPTGNCLRRVSYSAWDRCVSYRQETICVWFPIRLGADVLHIGRKLFAYGFLLDMASMCFIPTGNYSRMVSCPAWNRCFSYRQETIRVWFPVRLGASVFHTDRKLFAYGFLFGLGPMCFIPTGNCLRMVSYSAWDRCVSYRQETICKGFPIRLETDVFHTGRKLFAYGFLFGLAPWHFIPTGNYLRMVSYSAWDGCVSYRQETIRVWFPIQLGTDVFHTDRKLFAQGFLSGLILLCFISTGNCLRMVSYSAWDRCASYRQETVCVWFPIRLGTDVFHTDRKLFAKGFLFSLGQMCFIPTGNCLQRVSCPAWHCCVSYRQETIRVWFPVRLGTDVFHTDRKLFAYGFLSGLAPWHFIPAGNCLRMVSYSAWDRCVSYRQETSWRGDFSTPLRCARNDRAAVHYGVSHRQETVSLIPTQIIRPAGFCFFLLLW